MEDGICTLYYVMHVCKEFVYKEYMSVNVREHCIRNIFLITSKIQITDALMPPSKENTPNMNNNHLLWHHHIPGALSILSLILTIILHGRYYYAHFTYEKMSLREPGSFSEAPTSYVHVLDAKTCTFLPNRLFSLFG